MRWTLVLVLATCCFAEKPPCNAKRVGHFWPAAANTDRLAFRRFAQSGALQTCTVVKSPFGFPRYKWQAATVKARGAGPRPARNESAERR